MKPHHTNSDVTTIAESANTHFVTFKRAIDDPYLTWEKRRTKHLWDKFEAEMAAKLATEHKEVVQ